MRKETLSELKKIFAKSTFFTGKTANNAELYVFEKDFVTEKGRTIPISVLSDSSTNERFFHIFNVEKNNLTHLCIDGDLVEYGEKYDFDSEKFNAGRPDFMVFNDEKFIFVELKWNQDETSFDNENSKWKRFFDGANQILDFVIFLKKNNFHFYKNTKGIISMRFEPDFSIKSKGNTQRNTELFKIRTKLGFDVLAQNYFDF